MQADLKIQYRISATITGSTLLKKNALIASLLVIGKTSFRSSMVTIGSIAVTNPDLFMEWIDKYGADKLILGADVRNGKISINGWKEDSSEDLLPFLKKYIDKGVSYVLCTEISKDGTLQGPAIELYKEVMAAYPQLHLIASGGVSCNEDIEALEAAGIPAVVFGKAFYEGKIDVEKLGVK